MRTRMRRHYALYITACLLLLYGMAVHSFNLSPSPFSHVVKPATIRRRRRSLLQSRAAATDDDDDDDDNADEVFDITQNLFPETGKSLNKLSAFRKREKSEMNRRPPPSVESISNEDWESGIAPSSDASNRKRKVRARGDDDGGSSSSDANDIAYDITQNLFPETKRPLKSSAFRRAEKSEMDSRRRPPPLSSESSSTKRKAAAAAAANDNKASALFQKIKSERQQTQAKSKSKQPKASKTTVADSFYDITQSSFPERQSSSFNAIEKSEMNTRSAPSPDRGPEWSRLRRSRPTAQSSADDEASIRSNEGGRRRRPTFAFDNGEDAYLDVTSQFSGDRPSSLVNTGTKKDRTTFGSYKESKPAPQDSNQGAPSTSTNNNNNVRNSDESFVDITKTHYGSDRQSFTSMVNSGSTKRRGTTTGQSTSKSYEEGYKNIARNFSQDRASLLGHPRGKKVDGAELFNKARRGGRDGSVGGSSGGSVGVSSGSRGGSSSSDGGAAYLDTHNFSSKLSRGSTAAARATNAVWREKSTKEKEDEDNCFIEGCLDTPNAFHKDLDMVQATVKAVSAADKYPGGASKSKEQAENTYPASIKGGNEADKFLDTNSFSWNNASQSPKKAHEELFSSSQKSRISTEQQEQQEQYLDKPRVFQSNVDMVSSNNFSGVRHKRSSDIPPEEKNIRDIYDITSGAMGDTVDSGGTKKQKQQKQQQAVRREVAVASQSAAISSQKEERKLGGKTLRGGRVEEEEVFDITRAPFSKLERTSSVVIDENLRASKVRPNTKGSGGRQSLGSTHGSSSLQSIVDNTARRRSTGSSSRQSIGGSSVDTDARSEEEQQQTSYEEVMSWLLTNLPNLQEDDAISYFHQLLEDGFDNLDMMDNLMEEDLGFMKRGHRRVLLRNLLLDDDDDDDDEEGEEGRDEDEAMMIVEEEEDGEDSQEDHEEDVSQDDDELDGREEDAEVDDDDQSLTSSETLDDTFDPTRVEIKAKEVRLENNDDDQSISSETLDDDTIAEIRAKMLVEKEAWLTEQNRLDEEMLAAELALAEEEERLDARRLAKEEEEEAATGEATNVHDIAKPNKIDDAREEEYEDITRSSFVNRPSLSAAVHTATNTILPSSAAKRSNRDRKHIPAHVDELEEEVFDITRDAFPDRPSLASANSHHETPSLKERIRSKMTSIAEGPSSPSDAKPVNDNAPSQQQTSPSQPTPENSTMQGVAALAVAPRAELHQLYIKQGFTTEQAQRIKDYYTTWTNDAKSHELKFTCVFTCPLTGEHFACGNWKSSGVEVDVVVEENETYWYKTKKHAMNAAAARALDCFDFRRECNEGSKETIAALQLRCEDLPKMSKDDDVPSLPTLPDGISLPTIEPSSGT